MPRRLIVEIIGDDDSLQKAAANAAAALSQVKIGAAQTAETRANVASILDGVRGISADAIAAAHELDQVRLTQGQAAGSVAAGAEIKGVVDSIGDSASAARDKIAGVTAALVGGSLLSKLFGGGGGGGGLMGGGGGMFGLPGASFGSLGMFAGLGVEHILSTAIGVAGSGIQAMLGAGFLGLGAGGTMAVGVGTDMAGIGQAANDIKTVTPLLSNLSAAVQQYGKNSNQAKAAQQALNQALDGFSVKARAAVLVAARTANQFHQMFNAATGAAESVGAQIITEAMHVGEAFLPTIGKFALQNMNIIKRDIQPLFDWLKNGAFQGPGKGGGLGIFTNLEQIFQKNLPTSIHAMSQGFELLMKVIDVAAQHLGGFTKLINELLTKLNGPDFGKVASFVNSSIQAFDVWMKMFVALGKVLIDVFRPALGVGRLIIEDLTQLFKLTADWLGAKGTQDVLGKLFAAHKQEIDLIFQAIKALLPGLEQLASAFMQIEAVVTSVFVTALKPFVDLVQKILSIPLVAQIAGWAAALYIFGGALMSALAAVDPIILAIGLLVIAATQIYAHWGAISAFFERMWGDIKQLFDEGVQFVTSHWRDFVIGLATVVAGPLGALVAYIATHWSQIEHDASAAWDAIKSGVSTAWHDVLHAIETVLSDIVSAIAKIPGEVIGEAEKIGSAITQGILHGIGNLASDLGGAIKNAATGALHAVGSFLGIHSPSTVFANNVGLPIAQGIIVGYLLGIRGLPAAINTSVSNALKAAQQAVSSYQNRYATAFGNLAAAANQAFDAQTQKMLANAANNPAAKQLQALLGQFASPTVSGPVSAADTSAGKQLAALQAQQQAQQLQDALTQAQQQLATDQGAGASSTTILADQQAVANAKLAIQEAALQTQAQQEADAANTQIAALKAKAAAETKQRQAAITANQSVRKRALDEALKALQAHLAQELATHKQAQEAILKLLRHYGLKYKAVGLDVGKHFADGLRQGVKLTAKAAEELAREIAKYLPHSPAEKGPLSKPVGWQNYLLAGLPAATSRVSAAMAGLSGPTLGAAAGGGAGGGVHVNVTVNGWVGSDQEIAYKVRDELVAIGRREPNIFRGFA